LGGNGFGGAKSGKKENVVKRTVRYRFGRELWENWRRSKCKLKMHDVKLEEGGALGPTANEREFTRMQATPSKCGGPCRNMPECAGSHVRSAGCWEIKTESGVSESAHSPVPRRGRTGARCPITLGSTQVVDISSKMAKICVVSGLIYRRLRTKQAFFDPFIALKGVDLPSLTEKLPDFFAGVACTQYEPED
jgi:hypothetical protein